MGIIGVGGIVPIRTTFIVEAYRRAACNRRGAVRHINRHHVTADLGFPAGALTTAVGTETNGKGRLRRGKGRIVQGTGIQGSLIQDRSVYAYAVEDGDRIGRITGHLVEKKGKGISR